MAEILSWEKQKRALKHDLSGTCQECDLIFRRYPLFAGELMIWFKSLQIEIPDFHISCAGRGSEEQEQLFQEGLSRAHWKKSAHNFNAAIDTFRLKNGAYNLDHDWYVLVIKPRLYSGLTWFGEPHSPYYELPHIQIADWKERAKNGIFKLVEL